MARNTTKNTRGPRSRVTRGKQPFVSKVDLRTGRMRRWRDIHDDLIAQLGGRDKIGAAHMLLIADVVTQTLIAEEIRAKLAATGELPNSLAYHRAVRAQKIALQELGLLSRAAAPQWAKDAAVQQQTPSLEDHLRKTYSMPKPRVRIERLN